MKDSMDDMFFCMSRFYMFTLWGSQIINFKIVSHIARLRFKFRVEISVTPVTVGALMTHMTDIIIVRSYLY